MPYSTSLERKVKLFQILVGVYKLFSYHIGSGKAEIIKDANSY